MLALKDSNLNSNIKNLSAVLGSFAGIAAYDVAKQLFQPRFSGGGCITRTGYYVLMGSVALAVGRKVSKFAKEVYTDYFKTN